MLTAKQLSRLASVEALLRRPGTEGERQAAAEARSRIYRSAGVPEPPFGEAPLRGQSPFEQALQRAAHEEMMKRARAAQEEKAKRAHAAARAAAEAASLDELRKHRERAEAKAKADAAFVKRPANQRLLKLLKETGGLSVEALAYALGQKPHSVRAMISRLKKAGVRITLKDGVYRL